MKIDQISFIKIKSQIAHLGEANIKVVSDSMNPIIRVNQQLKVRHYHFNELKIFDTIVFWSNERLTAHYIFQIDREKKQVFTRGLKRSADFDLPVEEKFILGVVDIKISLYHKIKSIIGRKL